MKKIISINVRSYNKKIGNKTIKIPHHVRRVEIDVEKVTKSEYRKNFKKRPIAEQNRDMARTKLNAIPAKTKEVELKSNWTTKSTDWIGIDSKIISNKKVKMPKSLSHKQSTKYDDAHYDKRAYHDSSLTRHENDELEKERFTFRGMSHMWR